MQNRLSHLPRACLVEQKRLEHVALHLFTLPSTSLSEEHHAQAIWSLLSSIKQLSETFEQSFDTFSTTSTAFTNSQAALLKNKIGVQLYGIFPRLLFSFGERKGRHDRWLFNAVTLAGAALSMYHAAWSQSGWLGDHSLDALTFTDLLAGYVHIRAYETTEPEETDITVMVSLLQLRMGLSAAKGSSRPK